MLSSFQYAEVWINYTWIYIDFELCTDYKTEIRLFSFMQIKDTEEPASFLINSESENFHMEDPPEEYNSFESEYFKHSVARVSTIIDYV